MEKNKYKAADKFLNTLVSDLDGFKPTALKYLKAEFRPEDGSKRTAKFQVVIHKSFSGTPPGSNLFKALEYYSPALNAYACFISIKNETNDAAAKCFFDVGIEYFSEWNTRKESVLAWCAMKRANQNETRQYKIVAEKISNQKATAYSINKQNSDVIPKSTARDVLKQLTQFLSPQ